VTELDLPAGMERLRPQLGAMVAGMEGRVPYAAVLLSQRGGLSVRVDSREERVEEMPRSAGTVLTAFDGATLHEAAVGGFDVAAVEREGQALLRRLAVKPGPAIDPGPERRGDYITKMEIPPASLSTQEKLDRCRALQRRLAGLDARIVNAVVSYGEASEWSVFANRTADLAQRVQRTRMSIVAVVAGDSGVRYNFQGFGGTGGWELLDISDEELARCVNTAVELLSAERIEPGEYTVIASPWVTGTLVHESFGHGVETDMFLKERAKAARFIDKPVGSPLVNIWDDPSYSGGFGSYFFDDEGMLAAPVRIVEDGIFRRGITDLYSATMLGIPRSSNGRRQDFTRKAYARMTNTAHAKGQSTVQELFDQVEDGVYLEMWSSGMEDPQGWGIQVTCHYGHEIKNGRVTGRMYAPVGITGYVPDVLASVAGVGDEWALDTGGCGKGHKEWVSVASGGPHLLMKARLG
jgi:TldD protein